MGSKSTVDIFAVLLLLLLPSSPMLLNVFGSSAPSNSQSAKPVVDNSSKAAGQVSGNSYKEILPLVSPRTSTLSHIVQYSSGAAHPAFYLLPKRGSTGAVPRSAITQPPYSHGGPIMDAPVVYLLFWRPSGYAFDTSDSSYIGLLDQYFTDISGSNFYNILTQYYGSNGQPSNGVVFGGSFTYNGTFPNGEGSSSNPLLDSDIQTLVVNFNQHFSLTGGVDEEVFVFTPYNVYQCYDSSKKACAYTQYGGYHSDFTNNGHEIVYSYLPDLGTDCVDWCPPYPSPNNDQYADLMISVAAHEQFESVSDPITGTGWLASSVQTEIGDLCAGNYATVYSDGSNIAINGDKYLVQQMWSNYDSGCSQTFLPTFAHIALSPSLSSKTLEGSNFFNIIFPIGTDILTIQYFGGPVNATINPNSSFLISGNSTGSSSSEKWCLVESCSDLLVRTGRGQTITLNYSYYDLLPVQASLFTLDSGAPSISIHYGAAPDAPSTTGALNQTSLPLTHLDNVIWAQRGSTVTSSISASTSGGWQFESWTGTGADSYSGSGQISKQVNSAITEKATFYPGITVTAGNDGSISYAYGTTTGTVPAGTTQTIYVPQGTQITFTANPSSILFEFTSWTGVSSTGSTQTSEIVSSPSTLAGAFSFNYLFIGGVVGSIAVIGGASTVLMRRRSRPATPPPSAPVSAVAPLPAAAPALAPALTKLCISCNSTIPSADAHCPVCGVSQIQPMTPPPPPPPPTPSYSAPPTPVAPVYQTPTQLQTKACLGCGSSIPIGAGFCPKCGAAQPQQTQPAPPMPRVIARFCPRCGSPLTEQARFCMGCGQQLP